VVLTVLVIGDAGIIGRQALAREVGIGEGAVRTIIKRLRQGSYVLTDQDAVPVGTLVYQGAKPLGSITILSSTRGRGWREVRLRWREQIERG
jgi:hypothetical protein